MEKMLHSVSLVSDILSTEIDTLAESINESLGLSFNDEKGYATVKALYPKVWRVSEMLSDINTEMRLSRMFGEAGN